MNRRTPFSIQRSARRAAYLLTGRTHRQQGFAYRRRVVGRPVPSSVPTGPSFPSLQGANSRFAKELHGCDTDIVLSPVINTVNTSASQFTLNLIQQGSGFFNRIGRKISMKSLRLFCSAQCNHVIGGATGDQDGNTLRVVVVYDAQPSGVLPTYDTIFGRTDQTGNDTGAVFDNLRFDNTARFKVVKDCILNSNPGSPAAGAGSDVCLNRFTIDEYINLKGAETVYNSTANPTTIANISSGALYVYFRALQNDAASFWEINSQSFARLRFYD